MAARTSIARLGHLATSTRISCTHFRAQNALQRFQPLRRTFAASAMGMSCLPSDNTYEYLFGNTNQILVQVKKYTDDHEWVELDAAGKTGTFLHSSLPPLFLARLQTNLPTSNPWNLCVRCKCPRRRYLRRAP